MKKEFVPYELAVKLKELGFNEECFGIYDCRECKIGGYINTIYYSNPPYKLPTISEKEVKYKESLLFKKHILAPIWQQAFDWFRVEKDLYADIYRTGKLFSANIEDMLMGNSLCEVVKEVTYEEARQACLEKLIDLCGTL